MVASIHQVGRALQHHPVAQRHLLVALRRDGEDAHAQQVVPQVLEQSRVLRAADDRRVNVARLGGLDQLALHLGAVDPHGEPIDGGALGHGEEVSRLERPVGVVAEGLLDTGVGDLVVDGDGDLVVEHRQRRQALLLGNEQAVGVERRTPDEQHGQHRQMTSHGGSPFLNVGRVVSTSLTILGRTLLVPGARLP
jgi:hypothetical protein